MTFLSALLMALTVIVLIPIVTFSLQCFFSFLSGREAEIDRDQLPRVAVLIPSHNEEAIVSGIITDLKSQAKENDRIIVIADNCEDGTADVARSHGAEVFERTNQTERGKAYALRFALEKLEADPPEVVMVVDADCRISSDALAHLSGKAAKLNRPIQGSYIFGEHKDGAVSNNASSFTLWFKNHIRPLGSLRIGMPCQLTGSGMAFPWKGHPPMFCPEARIDGHVPKAWGTLVQQRRRWEQGYLESIWSNAPKMVLRSITSFRPGLLWAAFDLCIPPLALLGFAWAVLTFFAFVLALLGGSSLPAILLVAGAVMMGCGLALGWLVHCRDQVPVSAILAIPWFLVRKVGIYTSLLAKREKVWLRTDRD